LRLTLPGNLLITGEFAILEEGGQGITMAVEQRFLLEASPAQTWTIESRYPQETKHWNPGQDPFLDRLMNFLLKHFPLIFHAQPQKLLLDSRELFGYDRQGQSRKLGLGSSACTAAAMTALFWALDLKESSQASPALPLGTDPHLGALAVEAHRAAQGKKGSGYDVLCSLGGGIGHFIGGDQPAWKALELPLAETRDFALFPGESSVSTINAIDQWKTWKTTEPEIWQTFLDRNVQICQTFHKGSWEQAFTEAKNWGITLGDKLQVSAKMVLPPALHNQPHKALGAGNEIALVQVPMSFSAQQLEAAGAWPVKIAAEGLQWQ
jgi:phosphomevalonate kinase